jgi:hypothetical protein
MKKYILLLIASIFNFFFLTVSAQNPNTIEYSDLVNPSSSKKPDFEINYETLKSILAGKEKLFLYVKNAPNNFKYLGKIKRNKKVSNESAVAFDLTDYFLKKYQSKKVPLVKISIKGDKLDCYYIDVSTKRNKKHDCWEDK